MRSQKSILIIITALAMLSGCTKGLGIEKDNGVYVSKTSINEIGLENEAVALAASPAANDITLPTASGTAVEKNNKAVIDYSNINDGYIMVNFTASAGKKLKVRVTGPSDTQYTYNLNAKEWTTFPLSDGNGKYMVNVFENTADSKYAVVLTAEFNANMTDEFAPFLRPNQYVNYAAAAETTAKAAELTSGVSEPLEKVKNIYEFVINNLSYDKEKAKNVQSGYLPVLDEVLSAKKGICFDYAALMTAMLRSSSVPCKLVIGYAGNVYHAWISVWSDEAGWVDGAIYFDGTTWQRMDPTFASSGKSSDAIMKYISDGENYTTKYLY